MPTPTDDSSSQPAGSPTDPGAVPSPSADAVTAATDAAATPPEEEIGGPAGPDPTRFGDWERKGRCIDF